MSAQGFPFQLSISLEKPSAVGSLARQWSTDRVTLYARPWNWQTFTVNAPFTHKVTTNESSGSRTLLIDSDGLEGTVTIRSDNAFTSTITAVNARIQDDGDPIVTVDRFQLQVEANLDLPIDPANRSGWLWFSLVGLQSAKLEQLSLGTRITKASGEIEIFSPPAIGFEGDCFVALARCRGYSRSSQP